MSKKDKGDHIVAETDVTAGKNGHGKTSTIELPLHRRMDHSFLQYASYVIRDRAIPNLADGLKPVQRRILWSLHDKDDGRLIKVATIAGHCAQYHPHGEAAIECLGDIAPGREPLPEGRGQDDPAFRIERVLEPAHEHRRCSVVRSLGATSPWRFLSASVGFQGSHAAAPSPHFVPL